MTSRDITIVIRDVIQETDIQVFESGDPLKTFRIYEEKLGNISPFDLTGYTVTFAVKASASDSANLFSYTATITDATGGVCTVQFLNTDLATPGTYRYQLYGVKTSKRQTFAYGNLIEENV